MNVARRAAALFVVATLPLAARAERATERYAPVQLKVAQDFLTRAEAAAAAADYRRAALLASDAVVDARLTWAMTDEAPLRAQAAAIAARAANLAHALSALND